MLGSTKLLRRERAKGSLEKLKFEELKSLDLQKCATVGDIVDGMRYCAFGARMLGEVARTIQTMIAAKKKPVLIYSGLENSPLGRLLHKFVENKWCDRIVLPSQYASQKTTGRKRHRRRSILRKKCRSDLSETRARDLYQPIRHGASRTNQRRLLPRRRVRRPALYNAGSLPEPGRMDQRAANFRSLAHV